MRTMFRRSILNHVLMHLATEQGILPQLKWLPETHLMLQEIQTLLCAIVLLVLAHGAEEGFDEKVKPAEGGVVALDLAVRVPLHPGVDGDGDDDAEGRRVEGEDSRGGGDVVVGDELGDVVGNGDAHETDVVRLREEAEYVFGVEFAAVRCSGYVYTTFDLKAVSFGSLV